MNRRPLIGLIAAIVILIIVLAGYGFWYSLLLQKSSQVSSISLQIAEQNDETSQIEQAKAELAQLSTQETSINQYFVATSDVVPFLEQIQAIGKFLGANVEVASVSAVPGVPFGQLTLALNITGSFDAVARTIGSIEYSPYDTGIKSLSFNIVPTTASSSAPTWSAAAIFMVGAQTGNTVASANTATTQAQPASSVPLIQPTVQPASSTSLKAE